MDEKEKAAQAAKEAEAAAAVAKQQAEDKAKAEVEAETQAAVDAQKAKDDEIAQLKEERNNYKNVALKRLGKLDGDAEFLGADKDSGMTVEEIVKTTLLQREIDSKEKDREAENRRLVKENTELKLSLKNRPGDSIGSSSGGSTTEVKDNVFSEAQLVVLREKAKSLGADPEKFIEKAKQNLLARG